MTKMVRMPLYKTSQPRNHTQRYAFLFVTQNALRHIYRIFHLLTTKRKKKGTIAERVATFGLQKTKIYLVLRARSRIFARRKKMWRHRDVAQLVAHYVRDVGVACSSHFIPTKGGCVRDNEAHPPLLFHR